MSKQPIVLDAEWAPTREEREQEAVLRKWRAYTYSQRIMRAVWDKITGLMIAAVAIFLWAVALAVMIGMAAA